METTNLETARANAWHNMADWWLARCAELERRLGLLCAAIDSGDAATIADARARAVDPMPAQPEPPS